jgi:hypothetical protein
MKRKMWLAILALFLFTITAVQFPLLAQEARGIIRGTVYRDINANGVCVDEGEPRVAGIPVELVDDATRTIVRLQTGADGTYILPQATLGRWQVTVAPGTGWRVTSQQTREVVLATDAPEASEFDFCIVEVTASSGGSVGTTLPESGAPVAPGLLGTAAVGFALMAAGISLLLRDRSVRPE